MVEHPVPATAALVLTPAKAGLCAGRSNTLEVLVRLHGPDASSARSTEQSQPRALALVIDSSGSMQGRPLDEAKRCAAWVVSRMRPNDKVAVVQFDQSARLVWPAVEVGDGKAVANAIQSIVCGGATALHAGWQQGAESLAGCLATGLRRVILLSDGEANQGERDPIVIASDCQRWAAQGVTTSTYGLGESFNEELMVAMARQGGGTQYFGQSAEDLMGPFEQELSLIDHRCLTDLRLSFRALPGVSVDVLNDLPQVEGAIRLQDLAYGAEAWVLLRLQVPAWAIDVVQQGNQLLQVTVFGRDMAGETVVLQPAQLSLPVLSPEAWGTLPVDELASRRLTEVAAANALDNMRAAMRRGDFDGVREMLQAARKEFGASEWVRSILDAMEQLAKDQEGIRFLAKELLYSSVSLKTKLRSVHESAQVDAATEAVAPAFLRRSGRQGRDLR